MHSIKYRHKPQRTESLFRLSQLSIEKLDTSLLNNNANSSHSHSILVMSSYARKSDTLLILVDFFNKITSNHPELNTSEIIICYYLFMGFKNKEIAVFINNSVRSVESKRYRIANKLDLKKKKYKLVDYLKEHFKQTVSTLA